MLQLLAQNGIANWSALEWTIFIGSLTTSVLAIIGALKANRTAGQNKENVQTLAKAQDLTIAQQNADINQDNVPPAVVAAVKSIATGTGDGTVKPESR